MAVTSGSKASDHRQAALLRAGEQGLLCDESVEALPMDIGYRAPAACTAAGITYRQLDYWARTQLVEPSRPGHGSGERGYYTFADILLLAVVKRLLDVGISLQQIRMAVTQLRERSAADLAQITLVSDGVTVHECTSTEEVVDLLQGGHAVFGIALGQVRHELEHALGELPGEPVSRVPTTPEEAGAEYPADELARRRRQRKTG
ncbi:MerR family transcriptional regulator [Lipingzhangella sp. LS1_29]|uniref:MerR family transcriptional regulator n=1 Tax=Lipingzhangella rawalii TaxID=2055835 RepID=A0ABU2H1Q2_9ACTN|nr:MerR family transcriptional regulator [Lipingzhangella rawalii]MDS1269219.1 MerR family transcriptional regulator [Lipingzhangella rawalii]